MMFVWNVLNMWAWTCFIMQLARCYIHSEHWLQWISNMMFLALVVHIDRLLLVHLFILSFHLELCFLLAHPPLNFLLQVAFIKMFFFHVSGIFQLSLFNSLHQLSYNWAKTDKIICLRDLSVIGCEPWSQSELNSEPFLLTPKLLLSHVF